MRLIYKQPALFSSKYEVPLKSIYKSNDSNGTINTDLTTYYSHTAMNVMEMVLQPYKQATDSLYNLNIHCT